MNAVNGREKISSETPKIASQKFKKNIKTQKKVGQKTPHSNTPIYYLFKLESTKHRFSASASILGNTPAFSASSYKIRYTSK